MAISPELLKILRCPKCKSEVKLKEDGTGLTCQNSDCGLVYPVRDDIPVMIVEEAERAVAGKED
ncbi:MAG: Trm112 family protein [Acidobacteria bacterium]|nr:MAG: Trm112 family protein [Acidobacteriota bacterium]REJ99193.1 MAG: Trm112 family protein [Acidobacteriota bacterium]REK16086.1 MAG: Trm112 family protein [Acidobacteriota bacterium]REK43767.1 MAG: Trm112 family protein [Acidobacteriota bacterium]